MSVFLETETGAINSADVVRLTGEGAYRRKGNVHGFDGVKLREAGDVDA